MALVHAPAWQKFIEEMGSQPLIKGSLEDLNKCWENIAERLFTLYTFPPPDNSVKVKDITLENYWVRIYTPPSSTGTEPVGVFFHGGGWCMGSVEHEDAACRQLSKDGHMRIVSVEYRMAPEFKFPIPLDDCLAATLWTLTHFSVSTVVLMGGSAGANLAFGVALRLIDAGLSDKIKGILALVPSVIHPDAVPADKKAQWTSYEEHANHTINTLSAMKTFMALYQAPPDDVYFSCVLHPLLGDLKKVYIVECSADTLRDDARLMKGALEEANVPLVYDAYEGFPHYFWSFPAPVLDEHRKEFNANMLRALKWINSD